MRIIVDVEDDEIEFVRATARVGGSVRVCSRGETINATVVAQAEPLNVTGEGNQWTAFYRITPVTDL